MSTEPAPQAPIAPDPYRQAAPLGRLETTLNTRTPRRIKFLLWFATPVLLLGEVLVAALFVMQPPEATDDLVGAVVLLVLLGLFVVAGPAMWLYHRGRRIRVYEHGLEHAHRGRVQSVRWDDIARARFHAVNVVVNGIPTGTSYRLVVETGSGLRLVLNHFVDGVAELAARIERATFPRLVNDSLARWSRGEALDFGALRLDHAGLARGRKQLPWTRLHAVTVERGMVYVWERERRRPWAAVRAGDVANLAAFRSVVARLHGESLKLPNGSTPTRPAA